MSEIRTNLLSDLAGTGPAGLFKQSAAKAWANLNGTGTIALRDSQNVSSVVDDGVGLYTINVANAFVNIGYAISGSTLGSASSYTHITTQLSAPTTSSYGVTVGRFDLSSGAIQDATFVHTKCHGDLA